MVKYLLKIKLGYEFKWDKFHGVFVDILIVHITLGPSLTISGDAEVRIVLAFIVLNSDQIPLWTRY